MNEAAPPRKSRKTRWGQTSAEAAAESGPGTEGATSSSAPSLTPASSSSLPAVPFDVSTAAAKAREALEKAKKAALFQKQIQEQLAKLSPGRIPGLASLQVAAAGLAAKPRPLRLDRFGRELDEDGKVLPMRPLVIPTLKVNLNREKEEKLKQVFQPRSDPALLNPETNPFFDSRIGTSAVYRKKGLRFVDPGFYEQRETQMLRKAEARSLGINVARLREQRQQQTATDASRRVGKPTDGAEDGEGSLNPNMMPLGGAAIAAAAMDEDIGAFFSRIRQKRTTKDPIPEVEAWDMTILAPKNQANLNVGVEVSPTFPFVIYLMKISHLVEHPVPVAAPCDAQAVPSAVFLTAKERARLRRRKRQEKEKEKQDKIRMGLIPPPPPKIRLSNLMRVLGSTAVADPSKTERMAKEQMQKRIQDHEQRNLARKLDPDELRRKKIAKWQATPSGQVHVAVFAVPELKDKQRLFKVDKNAQQFHLTGAVVLCPGICNAVVAEGNMKGIKGYKKLLLRRIKWTEEEDIADDAKMQKEEPTPATGEALTTRGCRLVWEGVVSERSFKQWKVHHTSSEAEARKVLVDKHVEEYWDLVQKFRDPSLDIPTAMP